MREAIHPDSMSSFSMWHLRQRHSLNSTTDVDGYAFTYSDGLYAIMEHRKGGYNGTGDDNISYRMLKQFAKRMAVKFIDISLYEDAGRYCHLYASCGRVRDSRHILWIEYTADRPLAMYLTMGNRSPLGDAREWFVSGPTLNEFGCPVDALSDVDILGRFAKRAGILFRILIMEDKGIPSYKDQAWLRQLTYTL